MSSHKKSIGDLLVSLVGLAGAKALALIASVIIARNSGASTFGEYSLFITIFVIFSEVPNAIETTFIRFANSPRENTNPGVFQLLSILTKLMYAMIIIIIGWQFSDVISVHIFGKHEASQITRWALYSAAFMTLHTSIIAAYQQQKKYIQLAIIRPVFGISILLVVIPLAIWSELSEIGIIMRAYAVVCMVLGLGTLVIILPPIIIHAKQAFKNYGSFLRVCGYLFFASLIGLVANRLDVFFLTSHLSFEEVGYYGAAIRIALVVGIITAGMTTIYLPNASEATHDILSFKFYWHKVLTYSAIQTAIAIIVILNVDAIIMLLFGEEYASVGLLSIILIIQVLLEAYSRGFQALLQCGSKPHLILVASVIRLIVSVPLLYVLVPMYGAIGGALAVAIVSAVVGLFIVYMALTTCVPVVHEQIK